MACIGLQVAIVFQVDLATTPAAAASVAQK